MWDVRKVLHPDARVLVMGESGTGKETVAWKIHNKSARAREPFVAFNCASVAKELLESRFFGSRRGQALSTDGLRRPHRTRGPLVGRAPRRPPQGVALKRPAAASQSPTPTISMRRRNSIFAACWRNAAATSLAPPNCSASPATR